MANGPDVNVFSELASDALNLEYSGQTVAAGALYDLIRQQYANSENADLAAQAKETLANSDKRLGLLGKPFAVTGTTMSGEPLDTASLEGKVVLVDFWATWCGPCRAEFPNMKEAYAKYKDKGFEIIGVNLDDTKQQAAAYL
ncbi:MAG: TlpA family protein disulfide reductase, partial [Planctomycetales bacterium]|nr:TlpA family protein disulfide reductase [Planctomycetales bacterium]